MSEPGEVDIMIPQELKDKLAELDSLNDLTERCLWTDRNPAPSPRKVCAECGADCGIFVFTWDDIRWHIERNIPIPSTIDSLCEKCEREKYGDEDEEEEDEG